jgi:hypothetical protein
MTHEETIRMLRERFQRYQELGMPSCNLRIVWHELETFKSLNRLEKNVPKLFEALSELVEF